MKTKLTDKEIAEADVPTARRQRRKGLVTHRQQKKARMRFWGRYR